MKLVRFRLTNHSRLQDLDIRVLDHLVVVGPNDVGKSSLIRCMSWVLGLSAGQLYGQLHVGDLRDDAVPLVAEATLANFTDDERALFPDEISVDAETLNESLTIRMEATKDENGTLDVARWIPASGTQRQLSRDQLQGIGWETIAATSRDRDLGGRRNTSLDDFLSELDLGDELSKLSDLARQFQAQLGESKALTKLRTDLAAQLSEALPSGIAEGDLEFVSGAVATDDVLRGVELHLRDRGASRPIGDYSDGTRALFAIALYDLVSQRSNVVAIDEPETHLHPTGQRSLARLLQLGDNQKIISTHSADIVGAFAPEQIVAIRPGGAVAQPQAGFLNDEEKLVAHWWIRDRLEPLTAPCVVAVEGRSDRIVVEAAARATGRPLDRLGVSVIETGGAGSMGAISTLFGAQGFDIRLLLLIDADAAAATAQKLGVEESELRDHNVWVASADLEDEYVAGIGVDALWRALKESRLFTSKFLATGCEGDAPTAAELAALCRRKKIEAAIVVAEILDHASASAIPSVASLLDAAQAR